MFLTIGICEGFSKKQKYVVGFSMKQKYVVVNLPTSRGKLLLASPLATSFSRPYTPLVNKGLALSRGCCCDEAGDRSHERTGESTRQFCDV